MANVYINVEVSIRELEGRLLLALAAAERGHEVLLGKVSSLAKSNHLAPGIIHFKDLLPQQERIQFQTALKEKGFIITCQEEEHGLLDSDYSVFANNRFSIKSLQLADGLMCWGMHDFNELKRYYPESADKLHLTGSPRVDYWRPEFKEYYVLSRHEVQKLIRPYDSYVLIASNFGSILNEKRFWETYRTNKSLFGESGGLDKDLEVFDITVYRIKLIKEFIQAIRFLAAKFPHMLFVVRPHPMESEQGWKTIIGQNNNVAVIKEGSVGKWIRNAEALIYNGCTTAFEAHVMGKPCIAYRPFPSQFERKIPNRLGMMASNQRELENRVEDVIRDHKLEPGGSLSEIVKDRLTSITGPLASDKIVDVWDKLASKGELDQPMWANGKQGYYLRQKIRPVVGSLIRRLRPKTPEPLASSMFNPLSEKDLMQKVERVKCTLDRFREVKVHLINSRVCQLTSS